MDLQLKGKLALVSGSTAGIGLAIASALAQEGARVIVNGRKQEAVDAVRKISTLSRVACRREFEMRFTASRMAQDYVRLYEAMLSAKPLPMGTRQIDSLLTL